MTHDMLQVTTDMGHMTCDMWGEVNILSKFQLFSYSGLGAIRKGLLVLSIVEKDLKKREPYAQKLSPPLVSKFISDFN